MAGVIEPSDGFIVLDGTLLGAWLRGDREPPIGYLPDEPMLVDGSVFHNIVRFQDLSLLSAARGAMRAGVHEVLTALPDGYETRVGPGGRWLSMRERRAVAIARAFHGNPRVLILDRPETGLDDGEIEALTRILDSVRNEGGRAGRCHKRTTHSGVC